MLRALSALLILSTLAAAGPKPGIAWARSWDDAVEEARALHLPLVVHRHGFY